MEIEKYKTFSTPGKDVDNLLQWKVHEAVHLLLTRNLMTVKRGKIAVSKVKEFKKFNNIEKVRKDCTLEVKTLGIPVQVSAGFDEDEEILELNDTYSFSDDMEI